MNQDGIGGIGKLIERHFAFVTSDLTPDVILLQQIEFKFRTNFLKFDLSIKKCILKVTYQPLEQTCQN